MSCVDLSFDRKPVSVDDINNVIREASEGYLNGILGYDENSLVSADFNHSPQSSIAAQQTKVLSSGMTRFYPGMIMNGVSNRMADTAVVIGKLLYNEKS